MSLVELGPRPLPTVSLSDGVVIVEPTVLAYAAKTFCATFGFDETSFQWVIGEARARPQSTVYPLAGRTGNQLVCRAWYKVAYAPCTSEGFDRVRVDEMGAGLVRSSACCNRFAELAVGQDVAIARVLAVDAATLTSVTLDVRGKSLARGHVLRPLRMLREPALLRTIGRAVRILENSSAEGPHVEEVRTRERVEGVLRHAASVLDRSFIARLENWFEPRLLELEQEGAETAYVHYDLGRSNVFRSGRTVSLIDVGFRPALRGYDLATLSARLRMERGTGRYIVERRERALYAGYGDVKICSTPGFQVERARRCLQGTIARGQNSYAGRALEFCLVQT